MTAGKGLGQGAAALALLALLGCERIGNPLVAFGSKPPAPDEFQVIARKPLRMPATAALPEPRLGEPSPLEPNPNRDAVLALLGTDAPAQGTPASPGEQALLSAADAAAGSPEIRQTLALEASRSNEPYEPPSLFELLGTAESPPPDAIDAAAEARRLQSEGIAAAPVDPAVRPEVEEAQVEQEPSQYPAIGVERRGSISIAPLSTIEPAFD